MYWQSEKYGLALLDWTEMDSIQLIGLVLVSHKK